MLINLQDHLTKVEGAPTPAVLTEPQRSFLSGIYYLRHDGARAGGYSVDLYAYTFTHRLIICTSSVQSTGAEDIKYTDCLLIPKKM